MTAGGQRATVWVNRDGLPVVVSSSLGGLDAALKPYDAVREHLLLSAARFIPTEPRPTKPSTYTTQEVVIPAAGFRLVGSLSIPGEVSPAPCVILVSSAGPHTRDEEIAGVPIFKQIAEALAAEGFAVLRVDDRGVGASGGVMSKASVLPLAGDLQALVRYVRSRRELDPTKVALVGYGEGGEIASLVASTDPSIAALVLMATPAKTGADLCLE
ncbi:MAG: alpha/beta hydrolase family protein, partial [Armatimonadota bacterium]